MNIKHLWWKIEKMRHPEYALAAIDSFTKPHYYQFFQSFNKGVFAIEMHNPKLGFFAKLNWCLLVLYYCQRNNLIPYIELTSLNYIDANRGNDWFKYYFTNLALREHGYDADYHPKYVTRIRKIKDLHLPGWCYHELTLEHAAALFKQSIAIQPEIASEVDAFTTDHFANRKVLGVHYRGTDKVIEAPRVNWDFCEKTIRNYLADHSDTDVIFVATDEGPFLRHIALKFPDVEVISHDDHFRSEGGEAIHTLGTGGDNYLKGRDALVNSLLLSKCNTVIRSSSFLSAWSSIFNPMLHVILLNRPNENALWFPEVEIMKHSLDQYLPE
ncbi:nodulation protein NodZ [Methylomonas montana]|uniref:nodulation protein NodZ n=1 Tax=Methylomonas montana TaxID=3058963 RepID=UPI00265B4D05|nr:nodulation protein NodZ [Methylomonas montana]WKJ91883.1 nodulation protein NodZ [Methylomonas montana]